MYKAYQLKKIINKVLDEIPFLISEFEAKQLAESIVMTTFQTELNKMVLNLIEALFGEKRTINGDYISTKEHLLNKSLLLILKN